MALVALMILLGLLTACEEQVPKTATVRIETDADTCWSGAIGDATQDGCGPASFEIDGTSGIFSANAQKQDDSKSPLTVILVVDGEEVDRTTTSAAYGVAQVVSP